MASMSYGSGYWLSPDQSGRRPDGGRGGRGCNRAKLQFSAVSRYHGGVPEAPTPSLPLAQAVTEFLQWLELDRHASLTTVTAYTGDLGRFQAFCARYARGPVEVAAVDRDLLRAFQRIVARATRTVGSGRQPLAAGTRRRRLIALRTFLRFCRREEWLHQDLASGIDLPRLPERLPKPLEDAARERLVASLTASSLPEKRDRALLLLLLSTGARISELLRLDRADWARERLVLRGKGDRERPALVTRASPARRRHLPACPRRSLTGPLHLLPAGLTGNAGQPADRPGRPPHLPPARPGRRRGALPSSPAPPHAGHPPPGASGRRSPHRRDPWPYRPRVGLGLHQDHREEAGPGPASARGGGAVDPARDNVAGARPSCAMFPQRWPGQRPLGGRGVPDVADTTGL